jgi:hypothetical protein
MLKKFYPNSTSHPKFAKTSKFSNVSFFYFSRFPMLQKKLSVLLASQKMATLIEINVTSKKWKINFFVILYFLCCLVVFIFQYDCFELLFILLFLVLSTIVLHYFLKNFCFKYNAIYFICLQFWTGRAA